jgi:hypothetical protein
MTIEYAVLWLLILGLVSAVTALTVRMRDVRARLQRLEEINDRRIQG